MRKNRGGTFQAKYSMIITGMALTLLALTVLVLFTLSRSYREEFFQSEQSIARQIGSNLEYRFQEHEEYANFLSMGISDIMGGEETTRAEQYQEYTNISVLLTAYDGRAMISDIELYVPDEKMYSAQRDLFYPLSDLEGSPAGQSVLVPGIHWLSGQSIRVLFTEPVPAVACVMTARMKSNYARIASSLFLYIRVSDLYDAVSTEDRDPDAVFLMDSEGRYIVCRDASMLGQPAVGGPVLKQVLSMPEGNVRAENQWLTYEQIRGTDWYVVLRSANLSYLRFNSPRTLLVVMLWLVAAASIVFASVMITRNATVRGAIQTMRSMLTRAEEPGAQDTPEFRSERLESDDEIGKTVQALSDTIAKRYQEKLEMVDYQMQSLQEQIKPHFLYNTLDMINWMILDGKTQESSHIIQSLSRYLRLSINRGDNVVTLEKEIELIRLYLDLFLSRQTIQLDVQFDLDPSAMDCLLPRLTLQPAVENALLHGLLPSSKEGLLLTIRAWIEDDLLFIEIEDNGQGMQEEVLQALKDGSSTQVSTGYGLRNVQKRLQLFGGANAGLEINSVYGMGTCISIHIPVKKQAGGSEGMKQESTE